MLISRKVYEPKTIYSGKDQQIFIFKDVIVNNDLFKDIRGHRNFIKGKLAKIINPEFIKRLNKYSAPIISIHIRRGDFKYGNPITPLSFFIDAINFVRNTIGNLLPVTIFSDASKEEISEVFTLPLVELTPDKPDILDILLMSKSRIIILSQSSTFSYWSAFLSEAIIIKPHTDWQPSLRDELTNTKHFEGQVDFNNKNSLLIINRH